MTSLGEYDYIIAGAGAAGCVLANRLSADPRNSVLLVEAGEKIRSRRTQMPAGYLYGINHPKTDWCFHTQPEPGLNGRSIRYARGKGLGGSTLINTMLYVRGQQRDYDEWATLIRDSGWSWASVLPHFRAVENHHGGRNDYHGVDGEWRVERQRLRWEVLDRFAAAAVEAGIPSVQDFNCGDNLGVGQFEVNQRRGHRWSAEQAFLDPIRKRSNLTIVTGMLIRKILFEGRRARGLLLDPVGKGHAVTASCRGEVIVAAGALGSPGILQRSGIGDPESLRSLGIEVVAPLPGVGQNLQDHLQLRSVFRVQGVPTLNQQVHSVLGKTRMGLEYLLLRRGPLTMAPGLLGLFACSSPTETSPDLEFQVQPLSMDTLGDPLHRFPAFTASVYNLRPKSRGSVMISDLESDTPPHIAPAYLSHPEDRRKAIQALRLTRKIVRQPALAKCQPLEFLPGGDVRSDDDLLAAAGDIGTTIFHPVGTCKMGRLEDFTSVTDNCLRVKGVANCRVIDASVMPTITSGNTCSPTIVIAARGADLVLRDRFLLG